MIPCRRIGLVYNGMISLRPQPVYIRVQDLGDKPPRERARRPSRGRAEGAPWRTTGDARKAGAWVAAAEGLA